MPLRAQKAGKDVMTSCFHGGSKIENPTLPFPAWVSMSVLLGLIIQLTDA